jgi:hypothetical protein
MRKHEPAILNHSRCIVIGCPPNFRGSDVQGKDLELKCLKLFPDVPLFVEKPVAAGPVRECFAVAKKIKESGVICSVG